MTRKLSFLPLFFLALGSIFAAAVFVRVRAYQVSEEVAASPGVGETRTTGAAAPTAAPEPVTDSGEIVEIASTSTDEPGDRTAVLSAREQRYNELLRAAPPAPPSAPKPPPEEKSLVQRIINPVAEALGIKEKEKERPQPPPPPRPQPQQPPQQKQLPQAPGTEEGRSDDERPPDEGEGEGTDEDADTRPPQLMGLEFVPSQVNDGGVTMLIATVIDDLSGVRSVSGVVISPATTLQGFAGQREPETNRYVARIQISPEAPEGTWKVNYLSLSDNAGNSINLAASQGMLPPSAQFQVKSANSDSTPPKLRRVWLENDRMRAGEKNIVNIEAEDDKSGMYLVSGVFVSPSKRARIGFGCMQPPEGGFTWRCDFNPAANVDCGLWQLESIQLQDKARNMTTLRNDQPAVASVQLDIAGQGCDNTPAELRSFSLSPLVVSNAEGGNINVTAVVTDDISGVHHINGHAWGPNKANGPKLSFSLTAGSDGQTWIGVIPVPKNVINGTWSIGWLQIVDKAQNIVTLTDQSPQLAHIRFQVE